MYDGDCMSIRTVVLASICQSGAPQGREQQIVRVWRRRASQEYKLQGMRRRKFVEHARTESLERLLKLVRALYAKRGKLHRHVPLPQRSGPYSPARRMGGERMGKAREAERRRGEDDDCFE